MQKHSPGSVKSVPSAFPMPLATMCGSEGAVQSIGTALSSLARLKQLESLGVLLVIESSLGKDA